LASSEKEGASFIYDAFLFRGSLYIRIRRSSRRARILFFTGGIARNPSLIDIGKASISGISGCLIFFLIGEGAGVKRGTFIIFEVGL